MSSELPHRVWNTRERGTSTDQNRSAQLSDRNTALAVWYSAQNDDVVSGVLTGLKVSVSSDTVTVNPGLALLNDDVASYPDSPYRWMEVREGTTLSISVTGEKETGEWMVIELTPGSTDSIITGVDVFDPTTGAFVLTSATKEVQSAPEITVTTSGVVGQFPSATAGRLPLAYLYDDGGGLTSASLVHCRPLLWSKGSEQTQDSFNTDPLAHVNEQRIQGGGIEVIADGTTVRSVAMNGRFFNHRQSFAIANVLNYDLSDVNIWDGGVVASGEENVYLYACPPPYPIGYGGIAEREFHVGSAVFGQFATVHTNGTSDSQSGCIVVASTTQPDSSELGPQGAVFGSFDCFDTPFRDGGASATILAGKAVYMGAVDWATTEAKAQDFILGESRVLLTRFPVTDVLIAQPTPDTNLNVDLRDGTLSGGGVTGGKVPPHATAMRIQANLDMTTGIGGVRLGSDERTWEFTVNDNIFGYMQNIPIDMIQTGTGTTIGVRYSDANVTEFDILTSSYVDSIIATR